MYQPPRTPHLVADAPLPRDGEEARRPGRPVDPHRLWRALRRRGGWVLGAAALGLAVGYAVPQWAMGRTWESTTSLVFEGLPQLEGIPSPGAFELGTLVDSVELPANLARVKERRGFEGTLSELGASVDVAVGSHSNVLSVTARAPDAVESAALADTVVQVFLAHRVAVERQRLGEHLDVAEEDLARGEAQRERARAAYDLFRRQHGIADLGLEHQQAIEQAAALQAQADLARADAEAEAARTRQLTSHGAPRTPVHRTEHAALEGTRSELTAARGQYSEDHPRVQALARQVAVLEDQAAAAPRQLGAVLTGLSVADSAANERAMRERQQALLGLADTARQRIDRLSEIEGRASTLLAAVRVAEGRVDRLEGRRRALEDAVRNAQSGFRVVSPAVVPERPLASEARLAVAAGIPVAFVLVALVGLGWRELRGLRALTAMEVAYWGRGPVVGTTSWPRDAAALDELVAELDDILPDASGTTLVVPADDADAALSTKLAERMNEDWLPETMVEVEESSIHVTEPAGPPASTGTALARHDPAEMVVSDAPVALETRAWHGPTVGPQVRRAVRLADRVLVLVRAGSLGALELARLRVRLGRERGVGFLIIDAHDDLSDAADRAGDVGEFWLGPPR